ncbi:hypothetical protein DFAR_2520003 [Desulfarculales bacterium]
MALNLRPRRYHVKIADHSPRAGHRRGGRGIQSLSVTRWGGGGAPTDDQRQPSAGHHAGRRHQVLHEPLQAGHQAHQTLTSYLSVVYQGYSFCVGLNGNLLKSVDLSDVDLEAINDDPSQALSGRQRKGPAALDPTGSVYPRGAQRRRHHGRPMD